MVPVYFAGESWLSLKSVAVEKVPEVLTKSGSIVIELVSDVTNPFQVV